MTVSPNPNKPSPTNPLERHRMLTIFAVITALSAFPQAYYSMQPVIRNEGAGSPLAILFFLTVLGVYGATAWGLWTMKSWSRYALIGIIVVTFFAQLSSEDVVMLLLNLVLRGVVVYWFLTNGQYFEGYEETMEDFGRAEEFPQIDDDA